MKEKIGRRLAARDHGRAEEPALEMRPEAGDARLSSTRSGWLEEATQNGTGSRASASATPGIGRQLGAEGGVEAAAHIGERGGAEAHAEVGGEDLDGVGEAAAEEALVADGGSSAQALGRHRSSSTRIASGSLSTSTPSQSKITQPRRRGHAVRVEVALKRRLGAVGPERGRGWRRRRRGTGRRRRRAP